MSLFQYAHKTWGTTKQTSCPRHQNVTWQTNKGFGVRVSPPDLCRRDVAPPGLLCVSSLSTEPEVTDSCGVSKPLSAGLSNSQLKN